jgi:hypothetical protein
VAGPEGPAGERPQQEGYLGGEAGPAGGAIGLATVDKPGLESAEVCEPRHMVDLSDDYLERVGLLGAVRMFRSGSLFP